MRHFAFGLFICAALTGSLVHAQILDPCHNLHASACTGGDRNDGTGLSLDGAKLKENLETLRAQVARDMTPEIATRLKSDSSYRALVFNALGTELSHICRTVLSLSQACINKLAANAAGFMVADNSKGFSKVGLMAKYDLVASPITKAFKRSAEARLLASFNYEKKSVDVDQMVKELKAIMVRRVEKYVTEPAKRKLLIEQIQGIRNHPAHAICGGGDLPTMMVPNAFYMDNANTLSICPGVHLYTSSAYMLSFTIAHEIAHSIGPATYTLLASEKINKRAGTRRDFEEAHPFAQALQCLREVPTSGAKTLDSAPSGYVNSRIRMHHEMYYNASIQFDEIGETFADWLGIDVASEYLEKAYPSATVQQRRFGYTNAVRYFCGKEAPGSTHRSTYRRALTFAALPRVRKQMGCTDKYPAGASCGAGQIEASTSDKKKQESVR